MTLASGRTASSSRAIIGRDTIEVSSTTTTSCGSGFERSCRKRPVESGRQPSSRCRVDADSEPSRLRSCGSRSARAAPTACSRRTAAFPVGAARAILRTDGSTSRNNASSLATVVVLPVPGPPAMIVAWRSAAVAAARRCMSGPASGKSRRRPAAKGSGATATGRALSRMACRISCSSHQ